MIKFIIGLFVGGFSGIVIMCCCFAASKANEKMERTDKDKSNDNIKL